MSSTTFDRRDFIVGAGALAIASALPVELAAAEPAVGDATPRAKLTDWHIDDMWGVYPRPSEAIGYGRPPATASSSRPSISSSSRPDRAALQTRRSAVWSFGIAAASYLRLELQNQRIRPAPDWRIGLK